MRKFEPKGLKWAGPDFSWAANINFQKETITHTKNQQYYMNHLKIYISSNVGFRPQIYKLGPIGPKMGGARFFLDCNSQFSKRRT